MRNVSIKCVQLVQEPVHNPVLVCPLSYTGRVDKTYANSTLEDKPPHIPIYTSFEHTAFSTDNFCPTTLLELLFYPFSTPPTITTTIYN